MKNSCFIIIYSHSYQQTNQPTKGPSIYNFDVLVVIIHVERNDFQIHLFFKTDFRFFFLQYFPDISIPLLGAVKLFGVKRTLHPVFVESNNTQKNKTRGQAISPSYLSFVSFDNFF